MENKNRLQLKSNEKKTQNKEKISNIFKKACTSKYQ
jgi:hypothetical protein